MAGVCGIIISIATVITLIWLINKHMSHNNRNDNCNEKIRSLCGCYETSTATRNIGVSTRWQNRNGGFYSDESDATISYTSQPYPSANISGIGDDAPWNPSSRTRGSMRMPPPSYEFVSGMNSLHGFPTATQNPPIEVSSPYNPNSFNDFSPPSTIPDHDAIPNTPPPSYESIVGGTYGESNSGTLGAPPYQISNSVQNSGATAPSLPPYLSSRDRGGGVDRTMTPIGD